MKNFTTTDLFHVTTTDLFAFFYACLLARPVPVTLGLCLMWPPKCFLHHRLMCVRTRARMKKLCVGKLSSSRISWMCVDGRLSKPKRQGRFYVVSCLSWPPEQRPVYPPCRTLCNRIRAPLLTIYKNRQLLPQLMTSRLICLVNRGTSNVRLV